MEEQLPPRVTALIVARNHAALLGECIASIESSVNREQIEILVIDDGSSDGTSEVLHKSPDVISLRLPKRMGWTRAVNIGLRTAKGEFVFLMHPWFAVEPDTIARLVERVESGLDTGAVTPGIDRAWRFPSPADLQTAWKTGDLPGSSVLDSTSEHSVDYPQGAPILMRRDLLRAMHYLDERFGDRWADLEMCSRIRGGGKSIAVVPNARVRRLEFPPLEIDQLEWTDSAHGIATWIGLHNGFAAGLSARVSMAMHALGRGKTSAFTGILSGTKIDGHQE
jgi:GT2 family glycosyltransferase